MKIVYLLPGGLFNSGGMERVISIKANYLAEVAGYDVSIVTTEQMGLPVFYPLSEKVNLYHLNIGIHANFGRESYIEKCFSRISKIKEYKKRLSKLLNEINPDFTISTLGLDIDFLDTLKDESIKLGELHFPGNFRKLMARKLSDALIPNVVAQVRTRAFKKKCSKLARLIVLTHEEKDSWKNQENISVIPNPIPFFPEEISSVREKQVIAVGRLAFEKGFDSLIEAWKKVFRKHPDWKLRIFGSGNQKESLSKLIRDYALDSVIELKDPVKNIYEQYLNSSMFVLPSRYLEALPMVLIEAMSCGLPLVAFDAPCGPKDVIKEGVNGFLVKTGHIDLLSERIITLIESPDVRKTMGKAAGEMAHDYQVDKIMKNWILLFERIKNENNSFIGN